MAVAATAWEAAAASTAVGGVVVTQPRCMGSGRVGVAVVEVLELYGAGGRHAAEGDSSGSGSNSTH